jgi:hypothetical protein
MIELNPEPSISSLNRPAAVEACDRRSTTDLEAKSCQNTPVFEENRGFPQGYSVKIPVDML